ncbi:GDYXXLXY domain-containing protein [Synechococcus sp. PCC 7336]|uniref:GDYXXLXY domain-containing protein n=1 Tax=Synechococcus sp. PCC 7336 TaxID=195250 RepID=UPI000345E72F|nr:GDYXXLXY domain-containing protein [Synechococcus sp. PCC 7336]
MTSSPLRRRFPWKFALPLLFQLAIVLAIPIPKALTLATGETLYLQTVPIDPYDLLRGRYITLAYAIENHRSLSNLPGWESEEELRDAGGNLPDSIYLVMELEEDSANPVRPWQVVRVAFDLPTDLAERQRILKARYSRYGNIDVGLSQYFIPEAIGDELERDILEHRNSTLVEVKVDDRGNSALVGLWVEDRSY